MYNTTPQYQTSEYEWTCIDMILYCATATTSGSSHQPHQYSTTNSSSIPELGAGQVSVEIRSMCLKTHVGTVTIILHRVGGLVWFHFSTLQLCQCWAREHQVYKVRLWIH
jgi:hypothetical protein